MLIRADGRVERLDCGGLLLGVLEESLYQGCRSCRCGREISSCSSPTAWSSAAARRPTSRNPSCCRSPAAHRHLSAADLLGRITEELQREAGVTADDDTTLFVLKAL